MNQQDAEQPHASLVGHKIDTSSSQLGKPVRSGLVVIGPGQLSGRLPRQCRSTRMPSGSLGGEIPLGIPFLGAFMGANAAHATVRCHERGCSPSPSYRRPTSPLLAGRQRPARTTGHARAAVLRCVHLAYVRNGLEAG